MPANIQWWFHENFIEQYFIEHSPGYSGPVRFWGPVMQVIVVMVTASTEHSDPTIKYI